MRYITEITKTIGVVMITTFIFMMSVSMTYAHVDEEVQQLHVHNYGIDEDTETICMVDGLDTGRCKKCGVTVSIEIICEGEHDFCAWEVVKEATDSEEGIETRRHGICF